MLPCHQLLLESGCMTYVISLFKLALFRRQGMRCLSCAQVPTVTAEYLIQAGSSGEASTALSKVVEGANSGDLEVRTLSCRTYASVQRAYTVPAAHVPGG